jgi:protocatechuate 4,5-dioxygenase beta chain
MEKIVDDPAALARYTIRELVELAGSQGTEFIHWLMMRGALGGRVKRLHSNYHIPVSNTAAGLLLLESAA